MILALVLFLITYASLLIFPKYRSYIALGTGLIYIILKYLSFKEAFAYIDFNVLMMIIGAMGIVVLFIESKMPNLIADLLIEKTPNVKWAIVALAIFAGLISAFIDNVATVIMIAPIALDISKKLKISPVPAIISIAIMSNLQGVATLVGDTTSIMLAGEAGMNFLDFFFMKGKIGIFWVVQASALAATLILLFVFRHEKDPIEAKERTKVTNFFPTILLLLMILFLIIASFIPNKPRNTNGYICMALLIVALVYKFIKTKDTSSLLTILKGIDFQTILLLVGLFVVIGGITEAGIITKISEIISNLGRDNLFLIYTIIVWVSVLASAFVDNIPYVATMLPVVTAIAASSGHNPYLLYFGLLIGATLGGNMTPIGASANIASIGILRKNGYEVKNKDFMKLGVPFTLAAVGVGYILIWLIWA